MPFYGTVYKSSPYDLIIPFPACESGAEQKKDVRLFLRPGRPEKANNLIINSLWIVFYVEWHQLFRDCNPNQGKWTTTDPLGYPDGWNNLAYVNNKTVVCIDFCGTNLYELYDAEAVSNRGHVLPVATWQTSDGKWHASGYDYGGKSSGSGNTLTVLSASGDTEADVLEKVIRQCDATGSEYDEMSGWQISHANSLAAVAKMNTETQLPYDKKVHNCLTISKEARTAAGIPVEEGDEWMPVYALPYRTNRNNQENTLKQIQAKIKE